jgi:hypothetical protein
MISNASSGLPPGQIMREGVLMERFISGTLYVRSQPKIGHTCPPQAPPERPWGSKCSASSQKAGLSLAKISSVTK